MISRAINDVILSLFDHAAQGLPSILDCLKELFGCSSICISRHHDSDDAANDVNYTSNDEWLLEEALLPPKHPFLTRVNELTHQLCLELNDSEFSLNLQFECTSSLSACLNSQDIIELIPHIQQAIMIAEQLSRQHGDMHAIQYVISHHPLNALLHKELESDTSRLLFRFPSTLPLQRNAFQISANSDLDIQLIKNILSLEFNLTPSETELVKALYKGLSLQEIAERRSVSKQTIRKQFQSALNKTGCDSQEDLMLHLFDTLLTRLDSPAPSDIRNDQSRNKS